jgi:ankyrin repeat protein
VHPDTLTEKEGYSALMLAATMGSVETGRVLLEFGADPNLQEQQFGFAPLHFCAFKGNTAFIRLLIEGGANPYLKDNEGRNPLAIAQGAGASEAVDLLQ